MSNPHALHLGVEYEVSPLKSAEVVIPASINTQCVPSSGGYTPTHVTTQCMPSSGGYTPTHVTTQEGGGPGQQPREEAIEVRAEEVQVEHIRLTPRVESARGFNSLMVNCFQSVGFQIDHFRCIILGGNNIYFGSQTPPIYPNILHSVVTLVVKHRIIHTNKYETTQKLNISRLVY